MAHPLLTFPPRRTAQRSAKPTVSRPHIRQRAKRLSEDMIGQIRLLNVGCTPRPEPRTLFEDVLKGATKPSDETLFGCVIAAVSDLNTSPDAVCHFINWFNARLLSERGERPAYDRETAWLHDTEKDGVANLAEHQFGAAVARGDVHEADRIIGIKLSQIDAAYQLALSMIADRDAMQARA